MLLHGLDMHAPSLSDTRAWAEHHGLEDRPNHIVLVGDPRLESSASFRMTPGLQLIDAEFDLRLDAAGNGTPQDLWTELWPGVGPALDEVRGAGPRAR
jgi:hypothetical protein